MHVPRFVGGNMPMDDCDGGSLLMIMMVEATNDDDGDY